MPLLALIGTVAIASSSLAQNNPQPKFENNAPGQFDSHPARPFQETGPGLITLPPGLETPQRVADRLEVWAKKREEPLERVSSFVIFDPRDTAEFAALARYSLMLLTVVTQKPEELPLKRVYIRTPDHEIPLLKISSWRVNVDQNLLTSKIYGPYREDGFYLFPTSAYLRTSQVQADFAANRSGWPVLELPTQIVPKWLRNAQDSDPVPNALPNLRTLQRLIRRETSGFPVPDSLPQAAEPKKLFPDSSPQAAEPKKPGSLKELFNR